MVYDDNGIVPPNESQTPLSPIETACALIGALGEALKGAGPSKRHTDKSRGVAHWPSSWGRAAFLAPWPESSPWGWTDFLAPWPESSPWGWTAFPASGLSPLPGDGLHS